MKCPYCNKEALWVSNEMVYGKRYGKSYMCYYCPKDGAYVGCHENSKRPLGTMANRELRQWRMKAHARIDPYWRSKHPLMSRKELYQKLYKIFGKEIHVGESDIEMCKQIINVQL